MGWLSGILSGYADRQTDLRKEAADRDLEAQKREAALYQSLLASNDTRLQDYGATGILQMAQGRKRKSGFAGWMGEMDSSPILPIVQKYMRTPQTIETVTPGLPAKRLPQTPVAGQTQLPDVHPSGLMQTTNSPTEGGPMATPEPAVQPLDPTQLPGHTGPDGSPVAPTPLAAPPPPPPPSSVAPDRRANMVPVMPPSPAATAEAPAPPPPPPQLGLPASSEASKPSFEAAPPSGPLPSTPVPGTSTAPTTAGPPPPPAAAQPSEIPDEGPKIYAPPTLYPLDRPPTTPPASALTEQVAGPAVGRTDTRTYMPHLPSAGEQAAQVERYKVQAEVAGLQEVFKQQGDPDWQQKGIDAYMQQHARANMPYKMVPVEYTDPATGRTIEDFGIFDSARARFISQDGVTPLPADARPVTKTGGGALQPIDRAAKLLGYDNARQVPPDPASQAQLQAAMGQVLRGDSGSRAFGTNEGRYQADKSRINPDSVKRAAWEIAHDMSKASLFLNGRPQAEKDAITDEIARSGMDINKITESTRQMAETAQDILPVMDLIADDAKAFDKFGMMGPVAGRWQDFMTGKIGASELGASSPEAIAVAGKFRTEVDLLQKAVLRAHAGARGAGSPEGLERIEAMLSAAHMDLPTFLSSMAGFRIWMDQYAKRLPQWGQRGVEPDPNQPPPAEAPPPPPVAPDAHLTAMAEKYGAVPITAAATKSDPSALSPQFTGKLHFDSKTGTMIP